tara:strand:+ start:284 stop:454 length:171 start_codon:yes stop_codon:yes gene_type:complete
MSQKLYRVEQLSTVGWELVDEKAVKLTKDQAKIVLENVISDGVNPNDLRAIPERNV